MGEIVQKVATDLSFINGVLVPPGGVVTIDTAKGDYDFSERKHDGSGGNTPNLADIGTAVTNIAVPVAPIGPTGPNPTMPQQVPPGALQTTGGYAVAGGALLVAEGSQAAREAAEKGTMAEQFEEEGVQRRQAAEATGDATQAALNPRPAADRELQPGLDDAERQELLAFREQAAGSGLGSGLSDAERTELEELRAKAGTTALAPTPPTSATPGAFNPETVIDGTVPDVAGRLEGLSREQLLAVKDAENDREQPRVGVTSAIDAMVAKLDVPAEDA